MSKFLLCIFLIFTTSLIWCQSMQQKLESQKKQIRKDIINNEKMLKAVKSKEKSALNVYSLKKNKIKLQEKLITTNENQTKLLIKDIENNEIRIQKLENDLTDLKEDYAKKIIQSHKSKYKSNRLVFLLSSSNFLQAFKRIQYIKQYTNFRKSKGIEIKSKFIALVESNKLLNKQKFIKTQLLEQNKTERLALIKEREDQEKLVVLLNKDKKRIVADILKKQTESKKLDRQLDLLIRKAIAESNRKAAEEKARILANAKATALAKAKEKAKEKALAEAAAARANTVAPSPIVSTPTAIIKKPVYAPPSMPKYTETEPVAKVDVSSSKVDITPDLKDLHNRFISSKGKLIWPADGFISEKFGVHSHDLYNSLEIKNSGIEITTNTGAVAKAVFDGVVSNIIQISPVNNWVMVQHGEYFSVYQNLNFVMVKLGDRVTEKQNLGKIRTNVESGKTIVKFFILKNTNYVDPTVWLLSK